MNLKREVSDYSALVPDQEALNHRVSRNNDGDNTQPEDAVCDAVDEVLLDDGRVKQESQVEVGQAVENVHAALLLVQAPTPA